MSESLEFFEVTEGMTPDQIGKSLIYQNELLAPMCRKLSFEKPLRFVILGASIMNGAFGSSARIDIFKDALESKGIIVRDVNEYAVGGHNTTDTLGLVPTVISDYAGYESRTIVILHIGGNNISSSGPYPGGKDTLDSEFRQIISELNSAGFIVFPSSITYRVPPGSNPSAPYNQLCVIPAISELTPHALRISGRPIIDLYKHTSITSDIHSSDGVHYNSDGYESLAGYIGFAISDALENTAATSEFITDLIIDFGGAKTSVDFTYFNAGSFDEQTRTKFFASDGKLLSDLTVTISGFANSLNSSGTEYSGTGYNIDRPELTKDSLFVAHPSFSGFNSDTGVIDINGSSIERFENYELTIMACRSAGGDNFRWGTYSISGQTQNLDADDTISGEPNTISFIVSGAEIQDNTIDIKRRTEDFGLPTFAYISALRIKKL